MLTVTTDPELHRNELFRTPLRTNDMGMQRLALPRTTLETDFPVSEPSGTTQRWPGVMLRTKNMRWSSADTTYGPRTLGWRKRHRFGDSVFPLSITSRERVVAVTVAVHCSTRATFQALTSDCGSPKLETQCFEPSERRNCPRVAAGNQSVSRVA